jgi:hypothetical protein
MSQRSGRSSAEETVTPKDNRDGEKIFKTNNANKLELGYPETVESKTTFGEGELENLKMGGGVDPIFEAKAAIINSAFQHIGMGRYQWKLFVLCGFGWVGISLLDLIEGS